MSGAGNMLANVLLVILAATIPLPRALGVLSKKYRGDHKAEGGAQFISFLRRPENRQDFAEVKTGGGSLMDDSSNVRSSRRVQVSRSRLTALRHYRSWRKQQNTTDLPMTVIRDLGAEYVGSIGIGSKGCRIQLDADSLTEKDCSHATAQSNLTSVVFDTGSTNIWMASTLCEVAPCTNADRKRYDPGLSDTFHEAKEPTDLEVTFGTATLKGPLGVDDFHIGPFTVKDQAFALIEEESGTTFRDLPLEGIVGLAFPSMSANNQMPFFDSVIKQKVLRKNMFCFYLSYGGNRINPRDSLLSDASSGSDAYGAKIGAILWGGYDENLFDGPMLWFPVTKAHYWAIDLLEFRIGIDYADEGAWAWSW